MRTFIQKVCHEVQQRGPYTAEALLPVFPESTREQITKALWNGKGRGLVVLAIKGQGGINALPGVWDAGPVKVTRNMPRVPPRQRPANSPWELGEQRAAMTWPPSFDGGRCYGLPGSWRVDADEEALAA